MTDSCTVLLVMFNKAALSSYNFPFANVITLSQVALFWRWFFTISSSFLLKSYGTCWFQMVFAFMILCVMKSLKVISFTTSESLSGSSNSAVFVSYRALAQTLPLALTYLLFMVSSFFFLSFEPFPLRRETYKHCLYLCDNR